jgi:prepilin-type N-terminal cleavage/methylation domain-containing protein
LQVLGCQLYNPGFMPPDHRAAAGSGGVFVFCHAEDRSMLKSREPKAGFTLVELLVSALVVAVVMSAVIASASLAQATYRVHAEAADMEQRTRVLVHALQHDLTLAGAGWT